MSRVGPDSYLPCPPIPKGETPESWLRELTTRGATLRYGSAASAAVTTRLEHELETITATRATNYMLIVAEYVNWAKSAGICVSPGRGTVAGSVVAFALGITEVDPLRHGLLFERFLNTEVSPFPDIDLDFQWGRRHEVIAHIVSLYGNDSVAGLPSHREPTKVHAAAVLIADRPLSELTTVKSMPRTAQTQWLKAVENCIELDQVACHRIGLVQFDLLALKALRSLKHAVDAVERNHGVKFAPWSSELPLDDLATFEVLRAGDTDDVFQLGSTTIREFLRLLQPDRFDDLVALLALYRPLAMERGVLTSYIKRKHERVPTWSVHPEVDGALAPILGTTHGLVVYQEQLVLLVHEFTGISLAKAERIRRQLRTNPPSPVDSLVLRFRKEMEGRGFSDDAAEAVGQVISPAEPTHSKRATQCPTHSSHTVRPTSRPTFQLSSTPAQP